MQELYCNFHVYSHLDNLVNDHRRALRKPIAKGEWNTHLDIFNISKKKSRKFVEIYFDWENGKQLGSLPENICKYLGMNILADRQLGTQYIHVIRKGCGYQQWGQSSSSLRCCLFNLPNRKPETTEKSNSFFPSTQKCMKNIKLCLEFNKVNFSKLFFHECIQGETFI